MIKNFLSYVRPLWILFRDTFAKWSRDNASQLGAALAFYTIFSLAPIFIIIVAIVGLILGKESVRLYLLAELTEVLGPNNADYVMSTIQTGYQAGSGLMATIIAIFLMLLGATTICVILKNALNAIWGAKNCPSGPLHMLKDRLLSLLVIVFTGVFIFLSMVISSFIATASIYLSNYITIPVSLLGWLDNIVSTVLLALLFGILFKVLPDVKISWGDVWIGGALTAILFALGKYLLGLYLARSTVSSAYGAAGSLVVILLWVYYSAQIIFFGAEFTQVYAEKYGSRIVPKQPHQQAV
jgi:membrane protein